MTHRRVVVVILTLSIASDVSDLRLVDHVRALILIDLLLCLIVGTSIRLSEEEELQALITILLHIIDRLIIISSRITLVVRSTILHEEGLY